jgi:TRAP-type transport system small permease protein
VKRLLDALCGTLAALALMTIMGLTLVDVVGRKLLDRSLPGALEVTEIMMVLVIFAALPLVSLHGEHVVFDSLDTVIGKRLLRIQQIGVDIGCALGLAGIAWLMFAKAAQLAAYGDTTAQLKLPLAPIVQAMALLCAIAAAVHLVLVVWPVAHHVPGVGDDAAAPSGGPA